MARKKSFEAALHELERTVESLESGDLPLEDALKAFENGVKCAALCREALGAVESRVELLIREQNGTLSVRNFDEEE